MASCPEIFKAFLLKEPCLSQGIQKQAKDDAGDQRIHRSFFITGRGDRQDRSIYPLLHMKKVISNEGCGTRKLVSAIDMQPQRRNLLWQDWRILWIIT